MRAGSVVPIAGADAASGARRKIRAPRGSASRPIVEFSSLATNTQAEHYWHRRETRKKYVLKAGDNTTYPLDDQSRAAQYQDKQVKVVGRLDADSNTLHIVSIEVAS